MSFIKKAKTKLRQWERRSEKRAEQRTKQLEERAERESRQFNARAKIEESRAKYNKARARNDRFAPETQNPFVGLGGLDLNPGLQGMPKKKKRSKDPFDSFDLF